MNNSNRLIGKLPLFLSSSLIVVAGCVHNSGNPSGPLKIEAGMGRIACSIVQTNGGRSDEAIIDSNGNMIQDLQTHLSPSFELGAGFSAGSAHFVWIAEDSTDPGGLAEVVVSNNSGTINTPIFETHNDTLAFPPIISADGSKIAIVTRYGSQPDVMHYGTLTVLQIEETGDSIRTLAQHVITTYLPPSTTFALAPDGSRVAFIDTAGVLVTVQADGSGTVKMVTSVHNIDPFWYLKGWSIDWSSQNELAFAGEGMVRDVSTSGGSPVIVDSGAEPVWSPDGTSLAYLSMGGDVMVTPDLGKTKMNLTNDQKGNGAPSWSPDGKKINYTANLASYFQQPGQAPYIVSVDVASKVKRTLLSNAALGVWLR